MNVDSGLAEGSEYVDQGYRPVRRDLFEALRDARVDPADVVAIANSHLHFDHIGGNPRFPGVVIFVQRTELQAARGERYTARHCVDFPGARYEVLEGDAEPLSGIHILATPGHTPGSQSAVADTGEGRVVVGFHSAEEWERGIGTDRLRALLPRRVLFAHDERAWEA